MKLLSVVCRVEDELGEHLHNVEPAVFLDMLSAATEGAVEPPDELAELEAELAAAKKPSAQAVPTPAVAKPKSAAGMIILPREAAEPIVTAKTRGEVYEKLDELLSQFGARLAQEGE
jgi:hypothetical protein